MGFTHGAVLHEFSIDANSNYSWPPKVLGGTSDDDQFVKCSQCDELHNVLDIEKAFGLPDEYFDLSKEEREKRGKSSSDFCQFDSRYFIRSVTPIPVLDREGDYCWGTWVEVSASDFFTAHDTWNDDDVSHIPRLEAKLANHIPEYEESLGLAGVIELRADSRPLFYISDASRFRQDQIHGITIEDTLRYFHNVKP